MKASMNRRAAERATAMRARTFALALAGSLLAAGCMADPTGAEAINPPEPGALRGELVLYTLTYDDETSDEQYFLRVNGDERDERRLYFANDPELPAGGVF